MSGGNGATSKRNGTNYYGGVPINYFIKNYSEKDTISLLFFDSAKNKIQIFSTHPNKKDKEKKLKVKQGNNVFYWDMMYSGAERVKGMILWWASLNGPMALPGNYSVVLEVNGKSTSQNFSIKNKPNSESSEADLKAQFDFINSINTKMTEIHKALKNVKKVKGQIKTLKKSIQDKKKHEELIDFADKLLKDMTVVENNLYQTKSKSNQDPLNFPIKLNNKLGHLNSLTRIGDFKPTDQAIAFKNEITKDIDIELNKLYQLFNSEVKQLNQKVKDSQINFIQLD